MEQKEFPNLRLYLLGGFLLVVLAIYVAVLYDTQINDHEDYLAQSIRTITQPETVEASRGIITDRNGQVLVSNRSTYSLTFNTSLLEKGEDVNDAILRLVELCQEQEVDWVDNLPITQSAPFSYTLEGLDSIQRSRFLTYLLSLDAVAESLGSIRSCWKKRMRRATSPILPTTSSPIPPWTTSKREKSWRKICPPPR